MAKPLVFSSTKGGAIKFKTGSALTGSPKSTKSKKKRDITVRDVTKGNERSKAVLKEMGIDYKNPKDKPQFFDKLFGTLGAGAVGVESVIHNAISDRDDKLNPFKEMGKSVRGERVINGSHLLDELGVKPKSAFGKFVKGAAGVAIDIGADPLTYLSFGFSAGTKIKAAAEAARLFEAGLAAEDVARIAKYAPKILKHADEGGAISKKALAANHTAQKDIWKGILREVGSAKGDVGGVKMQLGIGEKALRAPLVKGSTVEAATGAIGKLGIKTPELAKGASEVAKGTGASAAQLFTPFFKDAREGGVLSAYAKKAIADSKKRDVGKALAQSVREAKEVFDGVDEDMRNIGTVALQRMDKNAPLKAEIKRQLDDAIKALDNLAANKTKGGSSRAQQMQSARLLVQNLHGKLDTVMKADVFDPQAFKDEVVKLAGDVFAPEQLDAGARAFDNFTKSMKDIRDYDIAGNAAQQHMGDRGLFYVAGQDGTPNANLLELLKKETAGSQALTDDPMKAAELQDLLDNMDNMRTAANDGGREFGKSADNYEGKVFDTLEERLRAGVGATTDAQEIMQRRLDNSRVGQANEKFYEDMARTFGEVVENQKGVPKELGNVQLHWENGFLTTTDGTKYRMPAHITEFVDKTRKLAESPSSVKVFNDSLKKLTGIWKSQAVATPGFFMRNAMSNFYLASAHGMGNIDAWTEATRIASGLAKDTDEVAYKGFKGTVGDLRRLIEEHNVADGGQMSELANEGRRGLEYYLGGGQIAEAFHKANSGVENVGRIAVFMQSLDTMKPREAANMADTVLYSYNEADLTEFEKGVKLAVPFYVWLRRNLPAQVSHLIHDPKVLQVWDKAKDNGDEVTGNTTNWGEMPQYMRDMNPIAIPLPNGEKFFLNPNFGWQDIKMLQDIPAALTGDFDPLMRDSLGALSPMIKTPAEFAFNKDAFYQSPIVSYQGETTKAPTVLQMMEKGLSGNDLWEKAKEAGGAKVKEDGTLMVTPKFLKIVQSIPMLATALRLTEDSPKQGGRLMSTLVGVKLMADESAKWHDNRQYEDRANLQDALRALNNLDAPVDAARDKAKGKKPDLWAKPKKPSKPKALRLDKTSPEDVTKLLKKAAEKARKERDKANRG